MANGKTIGNVNVLDIRKTSEETIGSIARISNANVVLYSPATASYLSRLDLGNINASIEVPADVELQTTMGNVHLTPGKVDDGGPAVFRLVMGNMFIEASRETSEFLRAISGLVVMGNIYCPESLAPALESKIKQLMGNLRTYPDDGTLIIGTLELTDSFLAGSEVSQGFVVTGSVIAMEPMAQALREKIDYLQVSGRVLCAEENAKAVKAKLRGGEGGVTVVPSGYRLRQGDLLLDAAALGSLDQGRIFCTGTVRIGEDVQPEAAERGLAGLRSLVMIVCPDGLKDIVATRLDLVADRAIFYEGDLWLFDGEHTLHASRFEYTEGKATALVTGELHIDPDVEPATLATRFAAVHNLGEIRCSPEQMGAIEARLGMQEGELLGSTQEEKEDFDIGNANVLTL